MKTIKLTQGKEAIVDDEDFDYLNQWKWFYCKSRKTGYAKRVSGKRPKQQQISMHRIIMQPNQGMEIDHIDHNGLNNQRQNLRNCSPTENKQNSSKHRNNTSGYVGVVWEKRRKKWSANIQANNTNVFLGRFDNIEDAAQAYDVYARRYYGEFACTNFKTSHRANDLGLLEETK
jgi:hypothetical protein